MGLIWYDADFEEPNCLRCDNLGNDEKFCTENCGAEHCWNGYIRREYSDEFIGDMDAMEYCVMKLLQYNREMNNG